MTHAARIGFLVLATSLVVAGCQPADEPAPWVGPDNPLLDDPDNLFTGSEDITTTTVYYQEPVQPAEPPEPPCTCASWDLYSCGHSSLGVRLMDYVGPGATPWDVVFSAFYLANPVSQFAVTTWQDVRRDVVAGTRLCLGNNGADPNLNCPDECLDPVIDFVNATANPVVYLVTMVEGRCDDGVVTDFQSASGAPLMAIAPWFGFLAPGDEAWFEPNPLLPGEFFPVFYDRYGYYNQEFCPAATFDFSGNFGPPFDWNRNNDFAENDDTASNDGTVTVVESGNRDEIIAFSSISNLGVNLASEMMLYELDIDAKLYDEVRGSWLPGNYEALEGIQSYLPGLNEPLRSAGDYNFHIFRNGGFPGPDAPAVANIAHYAYPYVGNSPTLWAEGNRYLPGPNTPYTTDHPDADTRTWMAANSHAVNSTMKRPNSIDGSNDRHYFTRVHPATGFFSWDTGCYGMAFGQFALLPNSIPNCESFPDVQQAPLQANGSPAQRVNITTDAGAPNVGEATLSSSTDIDWWDLVVPDA